MSSSIKTVYPESTLPRNTVLSVSEDVNGALMSNVVSTPADDITMSEFGERRVAQPGNRMDVEFIYDAQPLLFDDISAGNGSATHSDTSRDQVLGVGGSANGDTGGLRQHYWTPYTPGSGQEIDLTGTLDNAGLGGGEVSVFLRSTVSGTTTVQTIPQAQWIRAASGVDWSTSQIFRMSFQSLKVGRVQFALVRDGVINKVAEITNDNIRASGFWQYPSLPGYWKISNTATETIAEIGYGDELNGIGFRCVWSSVQSTATLRAICATVKSQGGQPLFEIPGYPFSTSTGIAAVTVGTTLIPLVSIRMAATFSGVTNRGIAIPSSYTVQTDNAIYYKLIYRPTLTGASFASVDATHSMMEADTSATAVTGGIVIDEDYISGGARNQIGGESGLLGRTVMSLGSSGTSDILTLAAVRTDSLAANVHAAIKWSEIR